MKVSRYWYPSRPSANETSLAVEFEKNVFGAYEVRNGVFDFPRALLPALSISLPT